MTTALSPADARAYITEHDKRVKLLDRKTVAVLCSIYLAAMRDAGMIQVMGGPESKDEFISAIVEIEFPEIRTAREVYVQSVAG